MKSSSRKVSLSLDIKKGKYTLNYDQYDTLHKNK